MSQTPPVPSTPGDPVVNINALPLPPTPPPHSHPISSRLSLAPELLVRLPEIPRFMQPLLSRIKPPQSNVPANLHTYLRNLEQIYEENPLQILKETKKFLSILNQELADHLAIYEQTTKDLLHEIVRQRDKSRDNDIFRNQKNSLTKENETLKESVRNLEHDNKTLTEELKKARQRVLALEENKSLLTVECAKIKQETTMLQIKLAENGSKEELAYIRERLTTEREHSNKLQQQVDLIFKNVRSLEDQKESLKLITLKEQNEVKRLNNDLTKTEKERDDLARNLLEVQEKLKKETIENAKLKEDLHNHRLKTISSISTDYKGATYAQDKTFFEGKIQSLQSDLEKARASIRALEDEVDRTRKNKDDATHQADTLRESNKELREFLEKLTTLRVRQEQVIVPAPSPKVIGFKNLIASEASRFNLLLNPSEMESENESVTGSGKRPKGSSTSSVPFKKQKSDE